MCPPYACLCLYNAVHLCRLKDLVKQYTVKPVLRGRLWDKEKVVFKDR